MPFAPGTRTIIKITVLIVLFGSLYAVGRPKLAVIFYNQGNAFLKNNQYLQAEKNFQLSLRVYESRTALVHYGLAQALAARGARDQAAAEYRKALTLDPAFELGYSVLADLLRQNSDYEEALALLDRAQSVIGPVERLQAQAEDIRQELGYSLLEQAVDAFGKKDFAVAQSLMARVLDLVPDGLYVQYTAGCFRYAENEPDQALGHLYKAVAIDPGFVPALNLMAGIYFDKGQFERALARYRDALSLHPDDPELLAGIGLSLMHLERYDQALEQLLRALARKPDDIDLLYSVASVYRDRGENEEALERYQSIVRLRPDYLNIHNDIADIYLLRGESELAASEFSRERDARLADLDRLPEDVYVLNSLAYAYAGLSEFKRAEQAAQRVLTIKPGSRQAYLTLARVYEKTQRPAQALEALQTAKGLSRAQRFIDERIERFNRENVFGKVKPSH